MNTPSHTAFQGAIGQGGGLGRWSNVRDEPSTSTNMVGSSVKGEGVILLLTDPSYQFSSKPNLDSPDIVVVSEDKAVATDSEVDTNVSSKIESEHDDIPSSNVPFVGTHLGYKFSSLATRGNSTDVNVGRSDGPKRGDLVSFSKAKGSQLVKDIRIEKLGAATRVTGTLTSVDKEADSAIFVLAEQEMKYNIKLTEVVSCDKALINELEKVDGILHEGKIFGGKILLQQTPAVLRPIPHSI
jgi:hypothetical protein